MESDLAPNHAMLETKHADKFIDTPFAGVICEENELGELVVVFPPERAGEIEPREPRSISEILAQLQSQPPRC